MGDERRDARARVERGGADRVAGEQRRARGCAMTMRLDVLTNDAGELVRREHARDLGAGVVVAIYRLMKLVQLHELSNQAFLRQLDQTHDLIADYCLRAGGNVNV